MDEIQEIIRLEGQASNTEKASSEDRWKAARLIHRQLQEMSFRDLSDEIKSQGGKGSLAHLTRMKRCWDLIGKILFENGNEDFSIYPNFYQTYNSAEVRGESAGKSVPDTAGGGDREPKERSSPADREPRDNDTENVSASGLVLRAGLAIATIHDNRPFWPLLTKEDRQGLVKIRKEIDRILTG